MRRLKDLLPSGQAKQGDRVSKGAAVLLWSQALLGSRALHYGAVIVEKVSTAVHHHCRAQSAFDYLGF